MATLGQGRQGGAQDQQELHSVHVRRQEHFQRRRQRRRVDAADNFSLGSDADDAVKTPPLRRGTFLQRCVTVFATFVVLATLSGSVLVYFLPEEELAELLRILLASKPLGRLAVGEVRDAGLQHRAADVAYEGAGMRYLYGQEDVAYEDGGYEDAGMRYAGVAGHAWGQRGEPDME